MFMQFVYLIVKKVLIHQPEDLHYFSGTLLLQHSWQSECPIQVFTLISNFLCFGNAAASRNCPEPMCANYCPNGYAHNAEGCMTCTCESQDESPPPPESIGKEEDFPCPEVMCATYCPTGYQRNERGCSTCTCNNGTVNDPSCGVGSREILLEICVMHLVALLYCIF